MTDFAHAFVVGQSPAQPAELQQLLDRTAAALKTKFPERPAAELEAIALAAWAQAEGERTKAYVDLEASTPYLLWLVDPVAGVRRPFPVADLVRLLGPRAAT